MCEGVKLFFRGGGTFNVPPPGLLVKIGRGEQIGGGHIVPPPRLLLKIGRGEQIGGGEHMGHRPPPPPPDCLFSEY